MSLQLVNQYIVSEQTSRIAEAAFPQGTLCLRIYKEFGTIFNDEDFSDFFPSQGQPAESPFRLALVTILQFVEGLSDRAAADAVRGRIDWKYLLCLEIDDPGFDYSVLSEFRTRLLKSGAEKFIFEKLIKVFCEKGLLKSGGRQRTDSTHVLAAIRNMSRLELVGETLRSALNTISTVDPGWIQEHIPVHWVEQYKRRIEGYVLPKSEPQWAEYATQVGIDSHKLLSLIYSSESSQWLSKIPAVDILRRVFMSNFYISDEIISYRAKDNIPPASLHITSPYDSEARYGRKRATTWIGYKVHLTETCDQDAPHLITNVITETTQTGDNDAIPNIHENLSLSGLLPTTHLVDAGYIEAKGIVISKSQHNINLLGPPQYNRHWQSKEGKGFDLSNFQIDWENKVVKCPNEKTSNTWKNTKDSRGNDVVNVVFAKSDCSNCSQLRQCTKNKTQRRTLTLRPQELHDALVQARKQEQTVEFKKEYNLRAGIEGTISQGVRAFELRKVRYIGMAKAKLQQFVNAAAMNFVRIDSWLAGNIPETSRESAFARTMLPLVA